MVHVLDEEWVDVVRGTLPPARVQAIAAHLDKGCKRCAKAREVWLAVAQMTGREPLYAPPDDTVRIARAAFDAARPQTEQAPFWATLVFDSLTEAAAGVRGFATRPRHLLYQAGALSIDLRLSASRGSTRHLLIGQVADADRPGASCGGCRIDVLAGERTVDTTSANDFGEFELQVAGEPSLALLVTAMDHRPVHVPLGDVVSGR